MTRGLRKFVLTAHVTFTIGWLGAVVCFLALATDGLTSQNAPRVSAAYIAMELIARYVIVPLSFAPLVTGPVLSLGTPWGLFRHYWILTKLVITILSAIIMQVHMQPITQLADVAANAMVFSAELHKMQIQMVIASSAALVALLVATTLAVYKPRGMTSYGWRKQYEEHTVPPDVDVAA